MADLPIIFNLPCAGGGCYRQAMVRLNWMLVWGCVLVAAISARGQQAHGGFDISPAPAWVELAEAPSASGQFAAHQVIGGVLFALIDEQVNVARDQRYRRIVREIVNEAGVQSGGKVSLAFDPSYQRLTIHHVTIHRGGEILDRLNPEQVKVIQQERELERYIYNGALSAVVFLEDVRIGDRVDFAWTVSGSNPIFEGRYADSVQVQWSAPIERQRFLLLWPAERALRVKAHGTTHQPAVQRRGGMVEYRWELRDVAAVIAEDSLPSWHDAYAWLQLSEYGSWAEVAEWAAHLYPSAGALSPALADKIQEWKRSFDQQEARLAAAVQFVQDEVRYMGFEIGPSSYRPADPSTVFARRFGDCKDKSYLLCAILERLGISAWPALVHSDYRHTITDKLPSPFAFDHVIVKVELDGRALWIDPTRSLQRGPIYDRYTPDFGRALLIQSGASELVEIPPGTAGRPKTTVYETFGVRGQTDPADFTVRTVLEGAAADRMRGYFARNSREQVENDYLNYYARQYPEIQLASPLELRDDPENNVFEKTERYVIQGFWGLSKDERQYSCELYPQTIDSLVEFPQTKIRSMPLAITHPRHEILRTEVLLPEPWPIENARRTIRGAAAELTRELTYSGTTLVIEYEFRSLTNWVPAAAVPAHLKSLDEMEDLLGYTLTWGNEDAPAVPFQINWSIVSLTGVYSLLLIIGAIAVYRMGRELLPPPMAALPPVLRPQPSGLGGWLILVAIGVVVSPVRIAHGMYELSDVYSADLWHALTSPAGEAYHALWGPVLVVTLLVNLTVLAFSILLLVLFFQQRRTFPGLFIVFLIVTAVVLTLDQASLKLIPALADEPPDPKDLRDMFRSYVACAIWIPYMLVSKRVKATFVR
jgi:transglutaminase-like putative cysteine protease